ncbi:MAG: hypothetical protein ACXWD4_15740 [Bacteroidia bacterium]
MRTCIYVIWVCGMILLLSNCKRDVTEARIRKAAERSNEINHKYVTDQRDMYAKSIEKRIETLEEDLEKLRDVSAEGKKGAGNNIESSVQQLAAEKALLEGSLRMLHEKTQAVEKAMDLHYSRYDYALDSILKDVDGFMSAYKTDYPVGH